MRSVISIRDLRRVANDVCRDSVYIPLSFEELISFFFIVPRALFVLRMIRENYKVRLNRKINGKSIPVFESFTIFSYELGLTEGDLVSVGCEKITRKRIRLEQSNR